MRTTRFRAPFGDLALFSSGKLLCGLAFDDRSDRVVQHLKRHHPDAAIEPGGVPESCVEALRAYFAGDLSAIDRLEVDPRGTPFQMKVWRALQRIPAGETRSYAQLARAVRSPDAVRAVGTANGSNPVSIVIPCHRVINTGGGLGGYGGGLDRKRWLLTHESAQHRGKPVTWQVELPLGRASA